jgi:putative molybdopterin biosynthesis protein
VKQQQFLEVIDRDEAETRWRAVVSSAPLPAEDVPLDKALGRVLGEDVRAEVDVPGFDRSNMDGFAVLASDTFGATEEVPVRLALHGESIPTGVSPRHEVKPGTATTIATGGMLPRGADAVVPVEHTDLEDGGTVVVVRRAVVPGGAVSFAGTDMGRGETVLLAGARLTSRETGVLAAIGRATVPCTRRPRVAVLSTGDEIVQPGEPSRDGLVYDSNGRILADAVGRSRRRSRARTWCCSPEARRRARAISTTASSRVSIPASWFTVWRSSPASPSAWRPTDASRW